MNFKIQNKIIIVKMLFSCIIYMKKSGKALPTFENRN